jgi:hypothetical protein
MDTEEVGWGGVDWIDLTQDKDNWRAFVNTAMNLRVHKCWENVQWLFN